MSTLEVLVTRINAISSHPNADRLELAKVLDWEVVVGKGQFEEGQLVIYVPVDSVLLDDFAKEIGVAKYLTNGRVRAARLRGVTSYGLIIPNRGFEEGQDVRELLGITKYEPPQRGSFKMGLSERTDPRVKFFTDIENIKNFPNAFDTGEEVFVTEKIHGTNCWMSAVRSNNGEIEFIAGSRRMQRRRSEESVYWSGFSESVENLLTSIISSLPNTKIITLYGEIYGFKIQNLDYGWKTFHEEIIREFGSLQRYEMETGKPGRATNFTAFDLSIDGNYADPQTVHTLCETYHIPFVPVLYVGPFDKEFLRTKINGEWAMTSLGGKCHISEGVVIRPKQERLTPRGRRAIYKWISDAYATDKNATDFH